MSDEDIERFNDSFSRCLAAPRFLDRFYELFIASSDEVAAKLAGVDLPKQLRLLAASFQMLMLEANVPPDRQEHLRHIAARHSRRDLDIKPHLYDAWLDCLVETVRECDPRFDARVERAWRLMMGRGIAFMRAQYDAPAR